MNEKQIKQALYAITQEEIADDMDLWPVIKTELERPRPPRSVLRLGRAAAVLALALIAGAAVYAVDQLLLQVSDPGLEAVQKDNLITQLNLSQTVGDLTLTLDYAYADANRISLAYHGSGYAPVGKDYHPVGERLTDDQGHIFTGMFGGGGGGSGGGGSTEATPTALEVSFGSSGSYDASIIETAPEELNLHLEVDVQLVSIQPIPPGATVEPGTWTGLVTGDDGTPVPVMYLPSGDIIPFRFDFTIPFNPGRVMDTPQTVTASGVEITLKKVVVTPSMTRVVICYTPPEFKADLPTGSGWLLDALVTVNGETAIPERSLGWTGTPPDGNCQAYQLSQAPALDRPDADWTLTITRFRLSGSEDTTQLNAELEKLGVIIVQQPDGNYSYLPPDDKVYDENFSLLIEQTITQFQEKVEGPWVFNFKLP